MEFYVDKDTDLMRSTFIAVGLAHLLYELSPPNSGQVVTIRDLGACYQIHSRWDVERLTQRVAELERLPPLLPAIFKPLTAKEKSLLEAGTASEDELRLKYVPLGFPEDQRVDYGTEKAIADAAKKYKPKQDTREEGGAPSAAPDFPLWAHLASYFGKGSAMRVGYPSILHAWHAHQNAAAQALWDLIMGIYGDFPNVAEAGYNHWREAIYPNLTYDAVELRSEISTLAVVSPSTSKGLSTASAASLLSEDTPESFWLEMYFAFAGFMIVGMPYTIGSDVVTYYPLIRDIRFKALRRMMDAYRASDEAKWLYTHTYQMNRAKLDALSHIRFYKGMSAHLLETRESDPDDSFPLNAINGIIGYYYKDISTQIPFDETTFALPAWLPSDIDAADLEARMPLFEEHDKLLRALRGKPPKYALTSDELTVIDLYRRYSTRGDALDWVRFAIAYGRYRFRNLDDLPYLPTLSLKTFKESLPMSQVNTDRADYRPILDDLGFQNIANAISYCTSYTQYMKRKDKAFPYRVWHGLGDDLLRNAHNADQFVADLSKFVHRYRSETLSVQKDTGRGRSDIQSDDLAAIVALIATYGSTVVAHLLVASGYAARYGKTDQSTSEA